MIPLFFRLKRKRKRPFRLWLPLILIWLVIIPLAVILGLFILVAAWAMKRKEYGTLLSHFYPLLFSALWALSGLSVEIEGEDATVSLAFI
jgi:ABC-type Na+ efflux pump permease subunit